MSTLQRAEFVIFRHHLWQALRRVGCRGSASDFEAYSAPPMRGFLLVITFGQGGEPGERAISRAAQTAVGL